MKAHIIENGIVVNTISVENLDFMPNLISADNGGAIGDIWDGSGFAKPEKTGAELLEEKENAFLSEVAQIKAGYSDDEIKSWDKQEAEARGWNADNSHSTPLIDAVVAVTGEDKQVFVDNVILKADLFAAAFGAALGRKRS